MMEINLNSHRVDHVSHTIANKANQVQSKSAKQCKVRMKSNPRLSPPLAQDTKKGHT